jgi:hypothetical protein
MRSLAKRYQTRDEATTLSSQMMTVEQGKESSRYRKYANKIRYAGMWKDVKHVQQHALQAHPKQC